MSSLTSACAAHVSRDASQHAIHCKYATGMTSSVMIDVEFVLLTVYSAKDPCQFSVGEPQYRARHGTRTKSGHINFGIYTIINFIRFRTPVYDARIEIEVMSVLRWQARRHAWVCMRVPITPQCEISEDTREFTSK